MTQKVRSWSAAMQPQYRCIDYLSAAAMQHTAPQVKINLTLLQYTALAIAVVGAETAFWALQPQRS